MHFCMDSDCDETPTNCATQLEQHTELIVTVGDGFVVGWSSDDWVVQVRTLFEWKDRLLKNKIT